MSAAAMITGECFCGEVKYRIDKDLVDARSCHCSRCRKVSGAQGSAYALVQPGSFKWLSGEELLTAYTGEHGFGLRFCSRCGSTLCGEFKGEVHGVMLGCLNGNPEITFARHIFTDSKAHWDTLPDDGVPQYPEAAPEPS